MTILDRIVAHKKDNMNTLPEMQDAPSCEADFSALFGDETFIIAEIKSKSPSEGTIDSAFDYHAIADAYIEGGAHAMSILTDHEFFGGSFEILKSVRARTALPLLCKDFIIDEKQVRLARACGADLCLLIVKILSPVQLGTLKDAIEALGMKAVVEIQNEAELEIALQVHPEIILINNRNLENFEVDMENTHSLLSKIPDGVCVIAASGITDPAQTKNFPGRVNGFLIGTALMRSDDKVSFLKECRR